MSTIDSWIFSSAVDGSATAMTRTPLDDAIKDNIGIVNLDDTVRTIDTSASDYYLNHIVEDKFYGKVIPFDFNEFFVSANTNPWNNMQLKKIGTKSYFLTELNTAVPFNGVLLPFESTLKDSQREAFAMSKGGFGEIKRILSRINRTIYPRSGVSTVGRVRSLV